MQIEGRLELDHRGLKILLLQREQSEGVGDPGVSGIDLGAAKRQQPHHRIVALVEADPDQDLVGPHLLRVEHQGFSCPALGARRVPWIQ